MTNNTGTEWRVLLVEDDPDLARSTAEALRRRPVNSQREMAIVDVVERFDEALKQIEERRYDVVILDIRDEEAVGGSREVDPHKMSRPPIRACSFTIRSGLYGTFRSSSTPR